MQRTAAIVLATILLMAGICHGQSVADAARENRKQKAGGVPTRVITSDDFSPAGDLTIHLVPGAAASGRGAIVAPGRGKHSYSAINLDATRFSNGGVLHITITLDDGASEASFDLYPQGVRLPSEGFPNSLASAHNVASGAGARIDYRFDHGSVFQLAAEGSWNAKRGDTNSYSFVVDVGKQ